MTKFSGGEIVMERLILGNTNHRNVIALPNGEFTERCKKNGILTLEANEFEKLYTENNPYYRWKFIWVLIRSIIKICRILYSQNYDAIIINNDGIVPAAGIASFLMRKPTIWICYNIYEVPRYSFRLYWLSKLTDIITPVSNAVKTPFIQSGVENEKLKVVYSGLNMDEFNPNTCSGTYLRSKYKVPEDCVLIGIIAAITRWKGHLYLLEALSKIKMSNWRLLIIGEKMRPIKEDELYLQELQEAIQQYNLQDKIIYTGKINDIRSVYCNLDIVVNSSIEPEPLGTTIYEGMAMKKIVIATNTGGSSEIISNNFDGFLVSLESCTEFSNILEKCILEIKSSKFDSIRINARKKAINKFSALNMVKNFNEIFTELVP